MADEEKKEETPAEAPQTGQAAAEEAKVETPKEEKQEKAPQAEEAAGEEVEVPEQFKKLVQQVEQMTVLELHELVKVLEKKFGVSAQAVAVTASGGGEGVEEQDAFSVELTDAGAQKIAVIKAIKELLGLGLKEAKDMVDGAPSMLKEGVKKEEAEEMKKKIEEAGGKATLK